MDKTETKEMEGELKPTDAGYKWFTCPTCDGTAKISQDQLEQINKDPLRSELQKAKEFNGEFLLFANEMVTESNFPGCNYTIPSYWKIKLESLIKKSENMGSIETPKFKGYKKEEAEEIPVWYTYSEMYDRLIRENYSKEIAKELSDKWANDLQGAFSKGYEKAQRHSVQQLKEYREVIRELLPLAQIGLQYESQSFYDKYSPIVDKARKLIDQTEIIK